MSIMDKRSNMVIKTLTILALITSMLIPAIVGYVVATEKVNTVMTVDAGNVITVGYADSTQGINETAINATFGTAYVKAYEANPDLYIRWTTGSTSYGFLNAITTVNHTNTVVWNYTDVNATWSATPGLYHYIELDITAHEVANHDFIRLVTNAEYQISGSQLYLASIDATGKVNNIVGYLLKTSNGTYITVITAAEKTDMLALPDENIYLVYYKIDPTDTVFSFTVEYNDLSESVWAYDDMALFDMSIVASIAIMAFVVVLNTKDIDVVFRKR